MVGQEPSFAQLYIFDTADEELERRSCSFRGLNTEVLRTIQDVLHESHPYIQVGIYHCLHVLYLSLPI